MQIKDLDKKDMIRVIELYFEHKKDFYESELLTIEDFVEQFCYRCDNCGNIICNLDDVCECEEEINETGFEKFDLYKDTCLYGL